MVRRVECANCRRRFEAKHSTAKYCCSNCRVAAARARKHAGESARPETFGGPGKISEATLAELEQFDLVESSLGRMALYAAGQLDSGAVSSGSAPQMLKQLQELMDKVAARGRSSSSQTDGTLDELAERRARRAG